MQVTAMWFIRGKAMRAFMAALLAAIMCACNSPESPKEVNTAPPVAEAGPDIVMGKNMKMTLDGSGSYDPGGTIVKYRWSSTSDEVILTRNDIASPVLWVPADCDVTSVEFTLTVTDDGGLEASDTCAVTIEDFADLDGIDNDGELYKSILYAAYAGIGAGSNDGVFQYNAMVYDPNLLFGDILTATLDAKLFSDYTISNPLFDLVRAFGAEPAESVALAYDDPEGAYHVDMVIRPVHETGTSNYTYTAEMTVNIATYTSYAGGPTYTGSGAVDLTAHMEGSYICDDISIFDLGNLEQLSRKLKKFICSRLVLALAESLSASYPGGNSVSYGGWGLSYYVDATTNRELMPLYLEFDSNGDPVVYGGPDIRDYRVSGAFSINGDDYHYCDGFHYLKGADGSYDGASDGCVLGVNGTMTWPGVDGIIVIRTGYNAENPSVDDSIVRDNAAGRWISGAMFINNSAVNGSAADVVFDGADAVITNGDDAWNADNWQILLDSYD